MKIYLPSDNTYNKCYVVQSEGVIRGYDRQPSFNVSYNYRDYYINSNYIYRDGSGSWGSYTTLPVCLDNSVITNNFYYHNQFSDVCIIFLTLFFIIIYLPFFLMNRFSRRLK